MRLLTLRDSSKRCFAGRSRRGFRGQEPLFPRIRRPNQDASVCGLKPRSTCSIFSKPPRWLPSSSRARRSLTISRRPCYERQCEIIGEALAKLAKADEPVAARISNYRRIIAFRNILIHGYTDVDHRLVWGPFRRHGLDHSAPAIGNTFALNGFSIGSSRHVSSSTQPKLYRMKLPSQIRSLKVIDSSRLL